MRAHAHCQGKRAEELGATAGGSKSSAGSGDAGEPASIEEAGGGGRDAEDAAVACTARRPSGGAAPGQPAPHASTFVATQSGISLHLTSTIAAPLAR